MDNVVNKTCGWATPISVYVGDEIMVATAKFPTVLACWRKNRTRVACIEDSACPCGRHVNIADPMICVHEWGMDDIGMKSRDKGGIAHIQ